MEFQRPMNPINKSSMKENVSSNKPDLRSFNTLKQYKILKGLTENKAFTLSLLQVINWFMVSLIEKNIRRASQSQMSGSVLAWSNSSL